MRNPEPMEIENGGECAQDVVYILDAAGHAVPLDVPDDSEADAEEPERSEE